ncbi:MAG: GYF domain-containing protein, partial [Terrimicrobiaceae bacterium]
MTIIFISRNREQLGQFSEEEVRAGLQSGKFFATDLAWKEGLAEWKPLATFDLGAGIVANGTEGALTVPPDGTWPLWEEAASVGWFKAWWETTSGVLFSPIQSFSQMKTTGGYGKPLLYAALCAALGGVMMGLTQGVLTMVTSAAGGADAVAPGASLCALPLVVGTTVASSAIFAVIGVFLWGGILHLCLMLFGGANQGFEATGRAVSY